MVARHAGNARRVPPSRLSKSLASPACPPATPDVRPPATCRPWFANRHLVNVNSLLRALRQRYSRRRVEVELAYMEVGAALVV